MNAEPVVGMRSSPSSWSSVSSSSPLTTSYPFAAVTVPFSIVTVAAGSGTSPSAEPAYALPVASSTSRSVSSPSFVAGVEV